MSLRAAFVAADSFIAQHWAEFLLYFYFLVMNMAQELPSPFNKIPVLEWTWEWQRRALQGLFAAKHPELDKKVTVESVEVQTTVGKSKPEEAKSE